MIFYFAVNSIGQTIVCSTQADAKAIDKGFQKVDIQLDKDSMQALLQESFDRIFDLEGKVNSQAHDLSIAPVTIDQAPSELPPAKQSQLDRRQIEELWPSFPIHWKLDMVSQTLDEVYKAWPKPEPLAMSS